MLLELLPTDRMQNFPSLPFLPSRLPEPLITDICISILASLLRVLCELPSSSLQLRAPNQAGIIMLRTLSLTCIYAFLQRGKKKQFPCCKRSPVLFI